MARRVVTIQMFRIRDAERPCQYEFLVFALELKSAFFFFTIIAVPPLPLSPSISESSFPLQSTSPRRGPARICQYHLVTVITYNFFITTERTRHNIIQTHFLRSSCRHVIFFSTSVTHNNNINIIIYIYMIYWAELRSYIINRLIFDRFDDARTCWLWKRPVSFREGGEGHGSQIPKYREQVNTWFNR